MVRVVTCGATRMGVTRSRSTRMWVKPRTTKPPSAGRRRTMRPMAKELTVVSICARMMISCSGIRMVMNLFVATVGFYRMGDVTFRMRGRVHTHTRHKRRPTQDVAYRSCKLQPDYSCMHRYRCTPENGGAAAEVCIHQHLVVAVRWKINYY